MAYLGTPSATAAVIEKYQFNFQKRYGQNFLIDTNILKKIIEEAGVTKEDCVVEIGPGIGTMTQYLAESAREVVAVEIDKNLIPILEDTLSEYDNVTVINEDILKVDLRKLAEEIKNGRHKTLKGLKKENLRDNMSTLELALNMLVEATTTTLTNSQCPEENRTMSELTEKRQKRTDSAKNGLGSLIFIRWYPPFLRRKVVKKCK